MGQQQCCGKAPTRFETVSADQLPYEGHWGERSVGAARGVTIWVDSVDDLLTACSLDPTLEPGGLEHLYSLVDSERVAHSVELGAIDELYLPRDIGVRCADPWDLINAVGLKIPWLEDDKQMVQNSYLCLQVDDLANPWGAYAVADGCIAGSRRVTTRLVTELPGLLARHNKVYANPCQALYECHMVADKLLQDCECTGADATASSLTTALLREGFLHIAWAGDSKVVLGRLAAKQDDVSRKPKSAQQGQQVTGTLRSASRRRPGQAGRQQEVYSGAQHMRQWMQFEGPPPILRAVDLTADESADGTGRSRRSAKKQAPNVRRMRLKPDDVCVVMGTSALWRWLTPEEVVTIVGQKMTRMAADAADALAAEVRKRMGDPSAIETSDELTLIVIYLAGENYVKEFDVARANHLEGAPFISESLVSVSDVGGAQKCCTIPFIAGS